MWADVAAGYRRWAEVEARGVSAVYEDWAVGVAATPSVLRLISELPEGKRQPNLVFAAARLTGAPIDEFGAFHEWLLSNWEATRSTILKRSTQTNEAGRCATLLPALARFSGPIALLEVGVSAGLCLYPDRYSYLYRQVGGVENRIDARGSLSSEVLLECEFLGSETPSRLPTVAWRAGIDLNPLDVTDADSMRWLETLVWPEHERRREVLRGAARIVASDPPLLVRGDLVDDLPPLIARAPKGVPLVIFHSAVLGYLSDARREEFADLVRSIDATWVSNEAAGLAPGVVAPVSAAGKFVTAVDGIAMGLSGPHGQSYRALAR